ncbi:MAG: putative DNA-binding domain-containing protein [Caulobacter sp.]|nr:putative DNA-binding domain-containing protein [Caulobacter sp.]
MTALTDFQDAFAAALAGDAAPLGPWLADAQAPGLSVYRNTIAKGRVDALAANFPTVAALVGDEWFGAAAALFAREHPPAGAALLAYGEGFAEWLARFPPADDLPYLPAMATMDALRTRALFAAEAEALSPDAFALEPEALAAARPRPHPSLAFAWFDSGLPALWLAARDNDIGAMTWNPEPQGILIVRPAETVACRVIDAATHAFLAAVRDEAPLGEAIGAAAEADPDTDLPALFAALIADGVFVGLGDA